SGHPGRRPGSTASPVDLGHDGPRDGGAPALCSWTRRWVMWGVPACLFLIAFLHRVALGVIAKDLMQAFAATGALVGLLSATYFYAYAGLMIPAGLLVDAFGVRRVLAVGGVVMGVGTLLMALTAVPAALFGGRLL